VTSRRVAPVSHHADPRKALRDTESGHD